MDIVDRLRSWAEPEDQAYVRDTDDMAMEAAAEIERLRFRLSKAERDVGHAEKLGNEAEGEVARLRDALDDSRNAYAEEREQHELALSERNEAREAARELACALVPYLSTAWAFEKYPWLEEDHDTQSTQADQPDQRTENYTQSRPGNHPKTAGESA